MSEKTKKTKKIEYADLLWLIGVFLGAVVAGVCVYFTKEAHCWMLCLIFGLAGLIIGNLMKGKNAGEQEEQRNAGNEK